jgi:hypothetical protein
MFAFISYNLASSTSALSILHTLIFQLTSYEDDLQEILYESNHKDLKSSMDVAVNILTTLLAYAGPVYVIIDGLDEIGEIDRYRLLTRLITLSANCSNMKALVSSRPEYDIEQLLKEEASVRIDRQNVGSIQAFVTQRTQEWFREREFFPEAQKEIQGLLVSLASASKGEILFSFSKIAELNVKGMFLYAKIVLRSIEFSDDMTEIRNELRVLPENLDDA